MPAQKYRNIGAPFTAESGERIETGATFVPSRRDYLRRVHKLRAVVDEGSAADAVGPDDVWPLKTPPAAYLEQRPDGPNAPLARRLLGEV